MANTPSAMFSAANHAHALSVTRLFVAGGLTASLVFVLCWLGTFIPFSSPTHAYVSLFTSAEAISVRALVQGAIWSLLFGALSGAMFALVYNATTPLARR